MKLGETCSIPHTVQAVCPVALSRYQHHLEQLRHWRGSHEEAVREAQRTDSRMMYQWQQYMQAYSQWYQSWSTYMASQVQHQPRLPPGGRGSTQDRLRRRHHVVSRSRQTSQGSDNHSEQPFKKRAIHVVLERPHRGRHSEVHHESRSTNVTSDGGDHTTSGAEEFEMEITEKFLEFFAHSAKFRQERDAKKKAENMENEGAEEQVVISTDRGSAIIGTEQAPTLRPGQQRTREMKILYGKGAAMIHGMETAMQLNYDRNCDLLDPKPWPQLPINIVFD